MADNQKTIRFKDILMKIDEIYVDHGREVTTYSQGVKDGLRFLEKKLTKLINEEESNE